MASERCGWKAYLWVGGWKGCCWKGCLWEEGNAEHNPQGQNMVSGAAEGSFSGNQSKRSPELEQSLVEDDSDIEEQALFLEPENWLFYGELKTAQPEAQAGLDVPNSPSESEVQSQIWGNSDTHKLLAPESTLFFRD